MNDDTNVQDKEVDEQPQSDLHPETNQADEAELPQDAKDRTQEQFEKLKQSNQELKEKLEKLETSEEAQSVLDSLKPKAMPQMPDLDLPDSEKKKEEPRLIDERGYVDGQLLEKNLTQAQKRALEAERRAKEVQEKLVRYEETQQTREAHKEFPQLDPNGKNFDKSFYKLVRNELIGQMVEGKKDLVKAARDVSKIYQPEAKEETPAETEAQKAEKKEQINSGTRSAPRGAAYSDLDEQQLAAATRQGKKGALAERLRRAGL